MIRTRPTLRTLAGAVRILIAVAMAVVVMNACSGSDPLPGLRGPGNTDAGNQGCIDKDGDGYGVGCALGNDCNDNDPTSTNECFGCTAGKAGCSCSSEGLKTQCGIPMGKVGNEVSCQSGTATCTGGKWSDCVPDTGSSAQAYRAPAYSTQGLGSGTSCSGNPCDPYCIHWPDTPDPDLAADAGLATNDAGLTLSGNGGTLGCGSVTQKAEPIPLDLYVMFDRSGSMGRTYGSSSQTRWQTTTGALKAFVNDPKSAGIGVALQYFPPPWHYGWHWGWTEVRVCAWWGCWWQWRRGWNYGWWQESGTCSVNHYATPDVAMGTLPGNAGAIVASLNARSPDGGTPTLPAEEGAVRFARSWKNSHPTHTVAIVLATDGEPNECNSTVANVSNAARNGYLGNPSVKTYVIGIGPSTGNLNSIATAGGTKKAFIASNSNSKADFIAAMNTIRNTALPCSYTVPTPPAGQQIDYNTLNIQYTSGSGKVTIMTQVPNAAGCTGGAQWYFTDATKKTMQVCASLCTTIQGDTNAQVNVVYNCVQQYNPGVLSRTFDASSACPSGTTPYWGAWTWSSSLPGNSGIDFKVAVATTAAGLSSAPFDNLQFTNPPGPSALAGQAIGARAANNTQNGSAVVEKTLIAHGRNATAPFLEIESHLLPSSDKTQPPTLIKWNLQVSCQPSN